MVTDEKLDRENCVDTIPEVAGFKTTNFGYFGINL